MTRKSPDPDQSPEAKKARKAAYDVGYFKNNREKRLTQNAKNSEVTGYERLPKRLKSRRARDKIRSAKPERLHWARGWAKAPKHRAHARAYRKGLGKLKDALKQSRSAAKRGGYLPCDPSTAQPPPIDGLCDHCFGLPGKRGLCLDHDHATGRFRGWLCSRCNMGFAIFRDNAEGLQHALDYMLRKHPWF